MQAHKHTYLNFGVQEDIGFICGHLMVHFQLCQVRMFSVDIPTAIRLVTMFRHRWLHSFHMNLARGGNTKLSIVLSLKIRMVPT